MRLNGADVGSHRAKHPSPLRWEARTAVGCAIAFVEETAMKKYSLKGINVLLTFGRRRRSDNSDDRWMGAAEVQTIRQESGPG